MTGLRKYAKGARRFIPLAGAFVTGLALLTMMPGCIPPANPNVTVDCGGGEALLGEVVAVEANIENATGTIVITASEGAEVIDNGDGTASVTSNAEGTVTVTATATFDDGTTDTDTCDIAFAGEGVSVVDPDTGEPPSNDVGPGDTINLSVNIDNLGEGGGEGDAFTFTWSVDPSTAGSFSCGDADQDPEDDNDTDCQSIGFTAADPCADATVTVEVTRNSDGRMFAATFAIDCIECAEDADCDNGLFCDGAETCVDGACVAGTSPCDVGDTCVEESDLCVPPTCTADPDCDDGVFCNGAEACVDGACVAGAAPCAEGQVCDEDNDDCIITCTTDEECDDGAFCNGTETCVDGACADGASPCAEGQSCDEDADSCGCDEDADCDNGVFCDGAETCDVDSGVCIGGTPPCNEDETCDEENAVCIPPTGQTIVLTTGVDVETGGSGDDLFDGSLEFQSGVSNMTLGNSDDLDGGDGDDSLIVQTKGAVTVGPAGLTSIESVSVEITDTNAATLSLANSDAVTSVTNNSSGAALTFSNGQTVIADFAVTNTGNNTTVTISKTNALNGTTDEGTLTLSSVTGGTFTAQPSAAGSGYETFNLVSSGGIANTLGTFSQGNGNSLTAMNFSGDQNLTITNALPSTVTTANASTMTGALSVVLPATNIAVTGGSGDDTVNDAGNYSTSDTLNGGDGTGDKLILNSAEAAVSGNQSNVSNFEVLQIANALAADLTISRFGATQINLVGGTGGAQTLTIPVGGTLEVSTAATAHNLTVSTPAGSDTTADTLNMNVKGVNIGGNLTASTWESLNLAISTAAVQFTGNLTLNNLAGTQKVTVTGNTNLTLGDAVGDTITADEIDASAFTGALTVTGTPQIAIVIKGGTGNDTLLGSTSGDDLRGSDGNDRLTGHDGTDVLTTGIGADTCAFGSRTNTGDVVADFDDGSSTTATDKLAFDLDDSTEANAWDDDTLTNAIAQCQGATADPIAAVAGTTTIQRITSDATTANTGVSLFIMDDGVEYTAATLQTALQAAGNRTITTGSDGTVVAVNFLVVYDKGSSIGVGVIRNAANATTTDGSTVTEIMSLSNISSLSDVDATDFVYE